MVAAVVYVVSLRGPRVDVSPHGFSPEEPLASTAPAPTSPPATSPPATSLPAATTEQVTYVPLAIAGRIPFRTRLAGLFGIAVLVASSAAVLAAGLYEAGHLINQTIAKFFGK
jgi:hypothetical protein